MLYFAPDSTNVTKKEEEEVFFIFLFSVHAKL